MPATHDFVDEEDGEVDVLDERSDYVLGHEPELSTDDPPQLAFTPFEVTDGRPIYALTQILSPTSLKRGQIILIKDNYAPDLVVAILEQPTGDKVEVYDIGGKTVKRLNLADHSVVSYSPNVWQQCRYMVDTGKYMPDSRLNHLVGI